MLPLLTLLAMPVSGQTIAGYEYWFDDGYAGRTEVRDAALCPIHAERVRPSVITHHHFLSVRI